MTEIKKKKPKQSRSEVTVASIMEAAARILEGRVGETFTTNKIAEVAGVSVGSLYQYFKNKESIVQDILFERMRKAFDILFEKADEKNELTPKEFIKILVEEQFNQWLKRDSLSKALIKQAPKYVDPTLFHRNDEKIVEFLKDKIEAFNLEGFKEDNLDLALKLSINTVRMSVFTYHTSPKELDPEMMARETTLLITNYLLQNP